MISNIKQIILSIVNSGTTFSIIFLSLISLIILQVVGFFYPALLENIEITNLFNVIILIVLTEILFLNINKDKNYSRVSKNETIYISEFLNDAESGKIREVNIISSGLSSRYLFIAELVRNKINVKILVQGKGFSIDKKDLKRLPAMINSIDISTAENTGDFLEIRGSNNIISLRAIIIYYKNNNCKAILSWYTYDHDNNVLGHSNPAIIANDNTQDSENLISFAQEKFDSCWKAAENSIIFPKPER